MFKKKTVFVVGAGASNELGFPLGTDLPHGPSAQEQGSDRLGGEDAVQRATAHLVSAFDTGNRNTAQK
jgi:hypothetical protein